MKKGIKIGDVVRVINEGRTYPNIGMVHAFLYPDFSKFKNGAHPRTGDVGEVVFVALHPLEKRPCVTVRFLGSDVVVGLDGVELVAKVCAGLEEPLFKVLTEEEVNGINNADVIGVETNSGSRLVVVFVGETKKGRMKFGITGFRGNGLWFGEGEKMLQNSKVEAVIKLINGYPGKVKIISFNSVEELFEWSVK